MSFPDEPEINRRFPFHTSLPFLTMGYLTRAVVRDMKIKWIRQGMLSIVEMAILGEKEALYINVASEWASGIGDKMHSHSIN
jgi:hypothetical protein